jgi:hypothetical protein
MTKDSELDVLKRSTAATMCAVKVPLRHGQEYAQELSVMV